MYTSENKNPDKTSLDLYTSFFSQYKGRF